MTATLSLEECVYWLMMAGLHDVPFIKAIQSLDDKELRAMAARHLRSDRRRAKQYDEAVATADAEAIKDASILFKWHNKYTFRARLLFEVAKRAQELKR